MRTTETLREGFRFCLYPDFDAPEEVFSPNWDDTQWESIRIPHDWAISGEFLETNDCSYSAVITDGIEKPIIHSGRTGALPTVGQGVYRKWLNITEADLGKKLFLEFDGIMWESEIYVNGKKAAFNHFGYRSFCVEITDLVACGGRNLLAVSAKVFPDCSRWYPGAGIFRNVRLVRKNPVHISYNGVWVRQLEIARTSALFELSIDYAGPDTVFFQADIISPKGEVACQVSHGVCDGELSDLFTIENISPWDVTSPNLYTARIRLLTEDREIADEVSLRFGARSCEFTKDQGMFLNGRQLKIQGVCLHHDLGSLGAAVNISAMRRQLARMLEMGVNSIRTSHNPPAPELLDLCDEMGILVMDEFFDEWRIPKIANGYAKYFREYAIEDMRSIMCRDRNHPSVILWSLGNEVYEQTDPEGWRVAKRLYEAAKAIDPTRPITCGFSHPYAQFDNHLTNFVDVVGINYKPHLYEEYRQEHPELKFVATETASTVSSRGVYHLPAQISIPAQEHKDLTLSAYELDAPSWAYYAERELAIQQDCPFFAGEYVWTGFDYLGEPTPYYTQWPSRSSYFGILDLAGLPKNRYYLYKSLWTKEPVLHIFPHWNWEGHEGKIIPVHVYTNYPEAELFVNGISQGRRKLRRDRENGDCGQVERFRLMWDKVAYTPGTLKVIAYDPQGKAAQETSVTTAGAPCGIRLTADRREIRADGDDLVYITASIVDASGNPCPHAANRLLFRTEGPLEVLTTDSGDPRETESFWRADKKAHAGLCVACCRSFYGKNGISTVIASAEGLLSEKIIISSFTS